IGQRRGAEGIVGRLPRGSACGGEGLTEKELAREGALPMSAIDGLARSEEVSRLVTPEILLPVQLGGHETYRGEKRLMLAVLEEAVATFQRHLDAKTRRGQRLFREAAEWIRSADTTQTFAFENVCRTLGLDPEYLRGGLDRSKQVHAVGGARVYRFRRVSGRRTSVVAPKVLSKSG